MLVVFTVPQVERLTGLSRRTLQRWRQRGVFVPEHAEPLPIAGPYRQVYSFRDVVGLRTLAILRRRYGVKLEELRKVGDYLRRHTQTPWASMRFWLANGEVVFEDPETGGAKVSGIDAKQAAIEILLVPIAREMEAAAASLPTRDPASVGQVDRHRYVLGNAWVVKGTRIPTAAIWSFHRAGYGVDDILAEYPDLTPADVNQAIAHEAKAHAAA